MYSASFVDGRISCKSVCMQTSLILLARTPFPTSIEADFETWSSISAASVDLLGY